MAEGRLENETLRLNGQYFALTWKTQTQEVEYYNLDVIISYNYRVK